MTKFIYSLPSELKVVRHLTLCKKQSSGGRRGGGGGRKWRYWDQVTTGNEHFRRVSVNWKAAPHARVSLNTCLNVRYHARSRARLQRFRLRTAQKNGFRCARVVVALSDVNGSEYVNIMLDVSTTIDWLVSTTDAAFTDEEAEDVIRTRELPVEMRWTNADEIKPR